MFSFNFMFIYFIFFRWSGWEAEQSALHETCIYSAKHARRHIIQEVFYIWAQTAKTYYHES